MERAREPSLLVAAADDLARLRGESDVDASERAVAARLRQPRHDG